MGTAECFEGSFTLMDHLFTIFTLSESTWEACERTFAKWLVRVPEEENKLLQDGAWVMIHAKNSGEKRWYAICEDAQQVRFFPLTAEDVSIQQCAVAMVMANFYDADAEASFERHNEDLAQRRNAVLRDETWEARMLRG